MKLSLFVDSLNNEEEKVRVSAQKGANVSR